MPLSPYGPAEPTHTINDEVTWLQGAFISSLLCGVQITLSIMSFLAVLKQRLRRKLRIALLIYIFFLCVVLTAGQEVSLLFIQSGFIQNRNYPGGPNRFLSVRFGTPMDLASTHLFMFGNWMMESLLVWRCKVVCCTGEQPIWIGIILPFVLLISEYVTGIIFLRKMLHGPHKGLIRYALAYSALSLLLNVTVTAIIAGRLLLYRRRMVKQFGRGHGSHYASVAAVLIESASLYTGFIVLIIVFFTVGTPTSNVLQQTVAQVECIASLLIIYRIAQGKGWNEDVVVLSEDWRGTTDTRAQEEEVQVERGPEPARTDVAPTVLSKDETQPELSESAVAIDATLCQGEVV